MLGTLAAVALAAAPVKVAVPGFTVVGMDQGLAQAWAERFVTLLGKDGDVKLITAKDIEQVLGLERQKQLLGCSDGQASCLAELAGALGVDAILSGTFAASGSSITATLRVLKAGDGSQLAAATGRVKDVEALQDWLEAQAVELAGQLRKAFKLEAPAGAEAPVVAKPAPPSSGGGFPFVRLVPGIVGVVAAGAGAGVFVMSKDYATKLRTPGGLTREEANAAAQSGSLFESLGLGLMIGGGVAVAASVVWAVAVPRSNVAVMVGPIEGGAAFAVGGAW